MSRWHLLYLSLLLTVSGCSTLSPPPSANASTEPRLHPDSATAASTDEAERQQLTDARAKVGPAIRGIAPQVRAAVQQAIAAKAAAPAASVVATPN